MGKSWTGWLALGALLLGGCTPPQQTTNEQVKREAAQDAKEVRKDLRQAGAEAQVAAEQLRSETKAALAGAKEGWKQGDGAPAGGKLDLNSASLDDLESLPGITPAAARSIVRGRPYDDPHDLVTRKLVTADEFARIQSRVEAR
jgi:DNA uptake protein ComE-like DNA-binding protein